jgi:hypothetical protein
MGLVLAIFCFIIGALMVIVGLGLIGSGIERMYDLDQKRHYYGLGGSDYLALYEGQSQALIVGGGFLLLFAFLLMWGGNRTRRPKEVRIKHD